MAAPLSRGVDGDISDGRIFAAGNLTPVLVSLRRMIRGLSGTMTAVKHACFFALIYIREGCLLFKCPGSLYGQADPPVFHSNSAMARTAQHLKVTGGVFYEVVIVKDAVVRD